MVDAGLVSLDVGVEVGEHLEELREVGIEPVEQVVGAGIADEDDLDVDRDGLGLEGRDPAEQPSFGQRDLELAGSENAHDGFPGGGFLEDLAILDDEVSAVGAEDGSGADAHVRHLHFLAAGVFAVDGAEQVSHGGVVLDDDRAVFLFGAFEDEVYAVDIGEVLFAAEFAEPLVDDILDDIGEEVLDAAILEVAYELADHFHEDGARLAAEEGAELVVVFAADLVNGLVELDELLAELAYRVAELVVILLADLALVVELFELLGRNGLAVEEREDRGLGHGSRLEADESEAGALERLFKRFDDFVDLVLGDFLDVALAGGGLFGGERRGEVIADEVGEAVDALAEGLPLPGQEGDEPGAVGLLEVVDVAACLSPEASGASRFEHALDEGEAAGAARTADVDVLAGRGGLESESERVDGGILAEDGGGGRDVGGGFEIEAIGIAVPAQVVGL